MRVRACLCIVWYELIRGYASVAYMLSSFRPHTRTHARTCMPTHTHARTHARTMTHILIPFEDCKPMGLKVDITLPPLPPLSLSESRANHGIYAESVFLCVCVCVFVSFYLFYILSLLVADAGYFVLSLYYFFYYFHFLWIRPPNTLLFHSCHTVSLKWPTCSAAISRAPISRGFRGTLTDFRFSELVSDDRLHETAWSPFCSTSIQLLQSAISNNNNSKQITFNHKHIYELLSLSSSCFTYIHSHISFNL